MDVINLKYEDFLKLKPIKNFTVYRKGNLIYKRSFNTLEYFASLNNRLSSTSISGQISLPKGLLFDPSRDCFYGYTMDYVKRIKRIENAKLSLQEMSLFMKKLMFILEELRLRGYCYYDIHSNNVLVNKDGNPFLVDLDGMILGDCDEYSKNQFVYLAEFIINSFLGENRFLSSYLNDEFFKSCISKESLNFLYSISSTAPIKHSFSDSLIDDLCDEQKIKAIKKVLR